MKQRRLISLTLFVLAVVLLVVVGLTTDLWLFGVLLGLAFALGGIFFYRRGK